MCEKKDNIPLNFVETVLEILDSMDAYAKRHWMHDEGEAVADFAKRLRRAYLYEKHSLREEKKKG